MSITITSKENKKVDFPIIRAFSTHNGVITFFDNLGFPHKYNIDDLKSIEIN